MIEELNMTSALEQRESAAEFLTRYNRAINPPITRLILTQLHLRYFPSCLTELPLRELNLSRNDIEFIPDCISKLTDLKLLNLLDNKIADLPETISCLTILTQIEIGLNKVTSLACFRGLMGLNTLKASFNKISQVDLQNLPFLRSLDLTGNELQEVIIDHSRLEWLNLTKNPLHSIRGTLPSLKTFQARQCHLLELEFEAPNVTMFDLSSNQLKEVPSSISRFTSLTTLKLGYNKLTFLPELSALACLKICYLTRNCLTSLTISSETLTTVEVEDNVLETVYIKGKILRRINLTGNLLTSIPECLPQLPARCTVVLSENPIEGYKSPVTPHCNFRPLPKLKLG